MLDKVQRWIFPPIENIWAAIQASIDVCFLLFRPPLAVSAASHTEF